MGTVVVILMFAVLAVLIAGVVLMAIGGRANDKYSNKLMSLRVGLQALTVLLLGLVVILANK